MIKNILARLKIGPAVVPTTEPLNSHVSRNLTKGSSYLVKEPKAEFSFELFVSLVREDAMNVNISILSPVRASVVKNASCPAPAKYVNIPGPRDYVLLCTRLRISV